MNYKASISDETKILIGFVLGGLFYFTFIILEDKLKIVVGN